MTETINSIALYKNVEEIEQKKNFILIETVKPRLFRDFSIRTIEKNKKEHKRINYEEGYYIGWGT